MACERRCAFRTSPCPAATGCSPRTAPFPNARRTIPLAYAGASVGELEIGLRPGERELGSADAATLRLVAAPLAVAIHALALSERPPAVAREAGDRSRGGTPPAATRPARRARPHPDRGRAHRRRSGQLPRRRARNSPESCCSHCAATPVQPSPTSVGWSTTCVRLPSMRTACSAPCVSGPTSCAGAATAPRSTCDWYCPTSCLPCQPRSRWRPTASRPRR